MTWGEFATILGFPFEDEIDAWGNYDHAWVNFRQWAGFRWDDDHISPDKPIGIDKAFQLLLLRLQQMKVFAQEK